AEAQYEPELVQIKATGSIDDEAAKDPLFDDAVRVVLETKRGSVSLLQRRLTIGYSRASRLIEAMAAAGLVGEYKGSQAREATITLDEWDAIKAQQSADADAGMSE
ncbi:MAG TPA: DNA translocase FtsK, partial [Tepidisphaeraceae bacterium]